MFNFIECILFILIIITDSSILKYISILFCFLYTLYKGKGYDVFLVLVFADYILLFTDNYELGIALFMIVQCLYHRLISENRLYFIFLFGLLIRSLIILGGLYAIMSLINIITSIKQRQPLCVTIILLGCCDICVMLQYVCTISIPLIWLFYLPSQLYYVKMVLSSKIEPL